MEGMFIGCSSLKELNLSNFNTNNVTNMYEMFYGCSSLKELNLSNFNTNNVKNLDCMFYGCSEKLLNKIMAQYKNIKERMNISIKDYKEYSEIYSSIEIEIKPVKNKYGEFINMNENEIYYHIYFNDNKEEIKRNYFNKNDNVSKIKIIIDYQVKSFKVLFYNCKCIEYICFKKFYRNNINDMESMFEGCSSLKGLNLSNFNTNNVTNMRSMFSRCSSL